MWKTGQKWGKTLCFSPKPVENPVDIVEECGENRVECVCKPVYIHHKLCKNCEMRRKTTFDCKKYVTYYCGVGFRMIYSYWTGVDRESD